MTLWYRRVAAYYGERRREGSGGGPSATDRMR